MADPVTPAKSLTLPSPGGDNGVWGQLINGDFTLIDQAFGGTLFLSISGNTALTGTQVQNTGYEFGGTLSANSSITWPAFSGLAIIQNNTSGAFALTCGVLGSSGTVSVSGGVTASIWSDGTNFFPLTLFPGGQPATGSGLIVLQTMPTIITPNVSGFITLQGAASGASVLTAPVSGGGTITFPPGTKTLADTVLDNVILTGDASNTGTAVSVVNLSHVTNNSLLPSGLASGFVILGNTQANLGLTTSGIGGLTFLSGSGMAVSGFASLTASGAATISFGTASVLTASGFTAYLSGANSIFTSGLSITGLTSLTGSGFAVSGYSSLIASGAATISFGTASTITASGLTAYLSGANTIYTSGLAITGLTSLTGSGFAISGINSLVVSGSATVNLASGSTVTASGLTVNLSGTSAINGLTTLNGVAPMGTLFQSSLPLVIMPSGTMAASGHFTLSTALPTTYASAYGYFASGAIQASGQAAGWFFVQMTSAVSGIAYNNIYTSGQPLIPGSLTAFVSAGTGAFSGVTAAVSGIQISIAGGAMAARGTMYVTMAATTSPSSGVKSLNVVYGGTIYQSYTGTPSGATDINTSLSISTQENVSGQYAQWMATAASGNINGSVGVGSTRGTVQTSGVQTLQLNVKTGLVTDYIVLEHSSVEILNGP